MNNRKKFRINFIVTVAAAVALVAVVNVFATVLQNRMSIITSDAYELSDRTKDYLKTFDTPAHIYIFESAAKQDENISNVLRRYGELNSKIKVENVNPMEDPTFGSKYTKKGESLPANSIIVASDTRYRTFTLTSLYEGTYLSVENKITPALEYVSGDADMKACFVTGHGELDSAGMQKKLKDETYVVEEWDSLMTDVPEDTSLVICFRPLNDFTDEEITKLDAYLEKGGHFQLYTDNNTKALTNLYKYMESWGIGFTDTMAADTNSDNYLYNGSTQLMYADVQPTPFTDGIISGDRRVAYLPYAKALDMLFESNGSRTVMPVLATTDMTYTIAGDTLETVEDVPMGARMIAGLAGDTDTGASVYAAGATFFMNYNEEDITGSVNYEYFDNLINYMLGTDASFTVNGKSAYGGMLMMNESQKVYVRTLVIIAIPLIVLICAVIALLKRRKLR